MYPNRILNRSTVRRALVVRCAVCVLLAALGLGAATARAAKVLYVQDLVQRDTVKLINVLKAQGHDLTVWTTGAGGDGNTQTAQEYADQGYELLIVDEVIGSSTVGSSFRNSPIPVINWEGFLYSSDRSAFNEDSGLVGGTYADGVAAQAINGGEGADYGQVQDETAVDIVDPDHPLAAGLPTGLVDVFDPDHESPDEVDGNGIITFAGGRTFAGGVDVVATVPGFPAGYAIFGVDVGVTAPDGSVNAARWVHLPWNDSEELDRVMIEPSFFLFEAAVAWSLDLPAPPKIHDLLPESGGFLATDTEISFSVDKTTAAGSAVSPEGLGLTLNGIDVIGEATVTDGGARWEVTFSGGLGANKSYTIVASATAADQGSAARLVNLDTFDLDNFTFEAEDFNFDGGEYFDDIVLCDDVGGGVDRCYFDRVGVQGIDKNEIDQTVTVDIPLGNEVYRYGPALDREEFTDTYLTGDPLLRQRYTDADLPDYEVRNIVADEWLNYTRAFPAGKYNIYARVAGANPFTIQMDFVDDATGEDQVLTKAGQFVTDGTAGYTLVPLTDDAGQTPLVVEFDGTTQTLRLTALSGGYTPNFYMLVPTEAEANQPPTVAITEPAAEARLPEGEAITVRADASDEDGEVAKVEFWAGVSEPLALIGEATVPPYEATFTAPRLGALNVYTIRAVAADDGGLTARDEISIEVIDPSLLLLTTAEGAGADVQLSEQSDSSGNGDQLNTRTSANGDRNEVVALRFDLTGQSLAELTDVSLNIVNFRDNSAREVSLYGVAQGSAGATGVFTTEDWEEDGLLAFGDMPGLLNTDGDYLTQSLNVDQLTPLGQITFSNRAKGTVEVFDEPALTTFVQGYAGSELITFILAAAPDYTSSGQARFAAKEATALADGSPTGEAGSFAPWLSFRQVGSDITIAEYSLSGDQLTLSWTGGTGPYTVQGKPSWEDAWQDFETGLETTTATVPATGAAGFYRVVGP